MNALTADELVAGSESLIVTADRDGTRILILNRPRVRNAMSMDLRRAYAALVAEAESDERVRVLVVTGAAGNFSAGVDLKDMRANPGRPYFRPHPGEATRALTKPVIAAVDGNCVTGGLELALSCSFIVASDRARFADTHAKVGLFPAWGQSALLPRAIGTRRARQMSLTGEFIDSRTACAWGLVNELTTPERLLPRCLELAAAMQACDAQSVRWQLEIMKQNDGAPLQAALDAEEAAVQRWRAR
ncbi:MAG: enoyl-CoA hydratase-related protein [Gammaproteobacteria bacterium]